MKIQGCMKEHFANFLFRKIKLNLSEGEIGK